MIELLPPPPPGKSGWPWTEESDTLPPFQPDGKPWPKISIVTPSYNQGRFIEETIRSVILQNYPNLEYIIIDGGSSDNTVNILRKYESLITYWKSEQDSGQSNAINKGFRRSTGEYVNWICSDDLLCKNALAGLSTLLVKWPGSFFISPGCRIDNESRQIDIIPPSSIKEFCQLVDLKHYWRNGKSILQQATIYPLSAVAEAGFLNEKNEFTMDYELWGKFFINGINMIVTDIPVGIYRWYDGQKTSLRNRVTGSLVTTAIHLVKKNINTGRKEKSLQITRIAYYYSGYLYSSLRSFLGVRRRIKKLLNG